MFQSRLFVSAFFVTVMTSLPANTQERSLAGSEWRVESITGKQSVGETEMFIQFRDNGELSGNGGCNRFHGSYTITENNIKFGRVAATRMACPEPVMNLETIFFDALEAATSFEVTEYQMTLSDKSGSLLAKFFQTDRD